MAKITINIPKEKEEWILDGFSIRFDYQEMVPNPKFNMDQVVDAKTNPMNIPNPETKIQFAKRMIIFLIKEASCSGHNQASIEANNVAANTLEID